MHLHVIHYKSSLLIVLFNACLNVYLEILTPDDNYVFIYLRQRCD